MKTRDAEKIICYLLKKNGLEAVALRKRQKAELDVQECKNDEINR